MQSTAATTALRMQQFSMQFAEADVDGNLELTFPEWLAMQPASVRRKHSLEEIKGWFEAADADGNGTVTINEYFAWSLAHESLLGGAEGIEALFRQYDKDGSGVLDASEFQRMAGDLGYDNVGMSIFHELDADSSGGIKYAEVIEQIQSAAVPAEQQGLLERLLPTGTPRPAVSTVRSLDATGL